MPRQSTDRLATLDLLRFVAAMAVVGFHFFFRGAAGEPMMDVAYPEAAPVAIYGYLGVHLFFVISGFVISYSAEGRDWSGFAVARFARIYPTFLLCMSITFLVLLAAADPRLPVSVARWGANLVILAPALGYPFMDGVYWSIVLELVFYGWVALALLLGVFDRLHLPLIAGWLALACLNEFALESGVLRLVLVTEYAPWFASGMLLRHMVRHGRSAETLLLFAASFLLSCTMLTPGREWMLAHYGQALSLSALMAANAVLHGLAILAVATRDLVRPGPVVLALGGLTYPLYLQHQHVGYVMIGNLAPDLGRWTAAALVIVAMVAGSWVIWRTFETPARRAATAFLGGLAARATYRLARLRRSGDAAFIKS